MPVEPGFIWWISGRRWSDIKGYLLSKTLWFSEFPNKPRNRIHQRQIQEQFQVSYKNPKKRIEIRLENYQKLAKARERWLE